MDSIRAQFPLVACLFLLVGAACAQEQVSFGYVQSFRKGPTHVQEQTVQVDLDPKNSTCSVRVKDANGRNHYLFACTPRTSGPGDNRIIAWQVRLQDLKHPIYPDVLMATPDPMQDQKLTK